MTSVMNILFLGTGTSTGVPQIGCSCAVCTSPDPRNRRLRSSVYVEAAGARLLLDSSPDLRQQALREHITDVDAVLYTHAHVDHVGGFDDLRAFCWRRSGGLPMYASPHDGGHPADHVRLGVRSQTGAERLRQAGAS